MKKKVQALVNKMAGEDRPKVRGAVKELRAAGVSWVMIVALLVKWGPTIWQIVQDFIASFKAGKSLRRFGIN